jgi:site-specific recombinase XerD
LVRVASFVMLESKLDIRMIQALLGHKRLDTTSGRKR